MKNLNTKELRAFREKIWSFYHSHGREFAWRNVSDPYKVVISEVMLQQTQTKRVVEKYDQFIGEFASFEDLAAASLRNVLSLWQGLGYNRRGMYLHKLAQEIVTVYDGIVPNDPDKLVKLPGIGPATASSICAFAFNAPAVFIETNIRTVFLHFFFNGKANIHDKELMPLIDQALDREHPREWYYALMDYGVMLKQTVPNPSRASRHHAKQSSFEGSDRQIRGRIIKELTLLSSCTKDKLFEIAACKQDRFDTILNRLISEKIIEKVGNTIAIP